MVETKNKVLYVGYGFNGEPGLESLIREGSFDIVYVVTPPPGKSRYRPNPYEELPVERLASNHKIRVLQTNNEDDIRRIIDTEVPESVLMCVYNKVLSNELLSSIPEFYNIHHGDLPRWRGSSSSEWAVISGRNEITLTLHEVVPELDSGDIFWQDRIRISDDETIVDMRRKMNESLRENLGIVYAKILNHGKYPKLDDVVYRRKQEGKSTYTVRIQGMDCLIVDWGRPARQIYNFIRGLCDSELEPAFTFYRGEKLEIWDARMVPNKIFYDGRIPGKPVGRNEDGVEVLTGDYNWNILLKDVGYRGKRMPASEAITSIRDTLGLNPLDLLLRIENLEGRIKRIGESI